MMNPRTTCAEVCVSIVPVFIGLGVGEAHGVVHAAANQLAGLVHHHLVHLVGVALPLKTVILSSFRIPIMCQVLKNINWGNCIASNN